MFLNRYGDYYYPCLAPSGTFIGENTDFFMGTYGEVYAYGSPREKSEFTLYNPGKIPSVRDSAGTVNEVDHRDITRFFSDVNVNQNSIEVFAKSDLQSLSQRIVEIAGSIAALKPDLIICPLRGAHKPVMIIDTLTRYTQNIQILPFTRNTEAQFKTRIEEKLLEILQANVSQKTLTKIAVVDTADGGYGSKNLAEMLSKNKAEFTGNWSCHFYLIHARDASGIARMRSIESLSQDDILFDVQLIEVQNLIFEDWDAAIGIEIHSDGHEMLIKPSTREGRFIYRDEYSIRLIESEDLTITLDNMLGQHISEEMQTHPQLAATGEIVWNTYINR